MTLNVTAVSYAPKLTLPEVQRLRSLLTAAGLTLDAETRTGDSRYEVYTADGSVDPAAGADDGEPHWQHSPDSAARRRKTCPPEWTRRLSPPRSGMRSGSSSSWMWIPP